jgi:acyl carrier protein
MLEEHITKKQGVTYISEEGLNLIKDSLKMKRVVSDLNNEYTTKTSDDEVATDSENFKLNSDYINYLKDQLIIKDKLIKEKDAIISNQLNESNLRLKDQQELTRNGQVLQSQNIKYIELTEKMREEPIVKKGFMSKLFNKVK